MDTDDRHVRARALVDDGVLNFGQFVLAGGQTSPVFVDAKRLVLSLQSSGDLVFHLIRHVHTNHPQVQAIGAPELGAVPLLAALVQYAAEYTWNLEPRLRIDGFVVRRATKSNGMQRRIEGPVSAETHRRVVLVDDVGTTGVSLTTAIAAVVAEGYTPIAAYCLVDRGEGAQAAIEALNVPYHALVTLPELLDAAEEKYHTMSHASNCAARHPGGECTCPRGALAEGLTNCGRSV